MHKAMRWTGYVIGGLVALLALSIGGLYGRGTYFLHKRWTVARADIAVPTDSASIAYGHRLAQTRGCLNCHSALAQGSVFFDQPGIARIVAPNIARLARQYSAAEFEGVLRHGVRPNGTGVVIMPSVMFANFNDTDVGAIIAYLRSLTPATDSLPMNDVRIMGRIGLATGQFMLAPQDIEQAGRTRQSAPAAGDSVAAGRYLAVTSCTECHGLDLRGGMVEEEAAPNLAVAGAYSRDEFAHLMRTGEPTGGRKLKLMADVAQGRFAHLTDDEVTSLHRYLQTLPAK